MKIVIDIPSEMYDWFENGFPDEDDAEKLWQIVKDGTPLPKGHGELKDMGNLPYVFDLTREEPIYSGKDIERAVKSMKSIIEADKEVKE